MVTDFTKKEYVGKVNAGTDAWTSPNHFAFVAVTLHWVEDGALQNVLLDIVAVSKVSMTFSLNFNSQVPRRNLTFTSIQVTFRSEPC